MKQKSFLNKFSALKTKFFFENIFLYKFYYYYGASKLEKAQMQRVQATQTY